MAEEAVITAPVEAPPEPALEPPAEPPAPAAEPHPLEPGGKRFNEVYARAKAAETKLQAEREERIRLEERLRVREEVNKANTDPAKQPVISWKQLETGIANGEYDRAAALEYREKLLKQQAVEEAEQRLEAKWKESRRVDTVTSELARFKQAAPAILQDGTPERGKVQSQYGYLVTTLGHPESLATELLATKLALGDVETLEKQRTTQRTTADQREVMMDTHSTQRPSEPSKSTKQPQLDARQLEHFDRMFKSGRFKAETRDEAVKEYHAELAYDPRNRKRG